MGEQDGERIGLTGNELNAYNANLDEINALSETVESNMIKDANPSKEKAAELWSGLRDQIPQDAFNGMANVSAQLNFSI